MPPCSQQVSIMKSSIAAKKRKGFAKVWDLWQEKRYDKALVEVDRLVKENVGNSQLLVMRSQLIRLQDDENDTPSLEDAKADLIRAAELDDQSPVPLIEMGYFLYAIDDDAKAASAQFKKSITLCKELLREALVGQAGALEELGKYSEAKDCLMQAYFLTSNNGKSSIFPNANAIVERLRDIQASE